MKVLSVLANPKGVENSASLKIEQAFREGLKRKYPDAKFEMVDVYRDEVPLLDHKLLPVFFGASAPDAETARRAKRQQQLLDQFLSADIIVVASPMWNFSVPPMLKAYIDTLVVAGKTFRYTDSGPEGLVKGKRAVLCLASGGIYEGTMASYDHLSSYLQAILGFIGITDVHVISAPGQALGAERAKASTEAGIQKARALAASF